MKKKTKRYFVRFTLFSDFFPATVFSSLKGAKMQTLVYRVDRSFDWFMIHAFSYIVTKKIQYLVLAFKRFTSIIFSPVSFPILKLQTVRRLLTFLNRYFAIFFHKLLFEKTCIYFLLLWRYCYKGCYIVADVVVWKQMNGNARNNVYHGTINTSFRLYVLWEII